MEKLLAKELVVIEIYRDAFQAVIAQDILSKNNIRSFLEEENILGLNPAVGVELKVRPKDFLKAKELLSTTLH